MENILDRKLKPSIGKVSHNAFSWLMMAVVQNLRQKVRTSEQLEAKLKELGYPIGLRVFPLLISRQKQPRRPLAIEEALDLVGRVLWPWLTGEVLHEQRVQQDTRTYYLHDTTSLVDRFISSPISNCSGFIAGIVEGFLDAGDFRCVVSGYAIPHSKMVYAVVFERDVLERDAVKQ